MNVKNKTTGMSPFKKIYPPVLVFIESLLILTYILFEELVWERFARPVTRLVSKVFKERAVLIVQKSNRHVILGLFLFLLLLAEALGVAAGAILIYGYVATGVALYLLKILFAGIAFWFLGVAKEKLFSIYAFKKSYDLVMRIKKAIENSAYYKSVKAKIAALKRKIEERLARFRGSGRFAKTYARLKEVFIAMEKENR